MAEAVRVQGLESLQSTLHALARALPDTAPDEVAAVIGQRARTAAPRRTGALVSSWAPSTEAGAVTLSFGSVYAGAVHFGVGPRAGLRGPHNIRANPFLTRAIDETQATWLGKYEDEINRLLENVKGA